MNFTAEGRALGHRRRWEATRARLLRSMALCWAENVRRDGMGAKPPTKSQIELKAGASHAVWRRHRVDDLSEELWRLGQLVHRERRFPPELRFGTDESEGDYSKITLGLAGVAFERARRLLSGDSLDGDAAKALGHRVQLAAAELAYNAFEIATRREIVYVNDGVAETCLAALRAVMAGYASQNSSLEAKLLNGETFLAGTRGDIPQPWPTTTSNTYDQWEQLIAGMVAGEQLKPLTRLLAVFEGYVDFGAMTPFEYAVEALLLRSLCGQAEADRRLDSVRRRHEQKPPKASSDELVQARRAHQAAQAARANAESKATDLAQLMPEREAIDHIERRLRTVRAIIKEEWRSVIDEASSPGRQQVKREVEWDYQFDVLAVFAYHAAVKGKHIQVAHQISWQLGELVGAGEGPFMHPGVREISMGRHLLEPATLPMGLSKELVGIAKQLDNVLATVRMARAFNRPVKDVEWLNEIRDQAHRILNLVTEISRHTDPSITSDNAENPM